MRHLSRRECFPLALGLPLAAALPGCWSSGATPGPLPPAEPVEVPDAAGATKFALALWPELAAKPGSGFYSPFSVRQALAMTAAGAAGPTLDEFVKVLHLPADPAQADAEAAATLLALGDAPGRPPRGYELSAANALWAQAGTPWAKPFTGRVAASYRAGVFTVDYARDTEGSRATINKWVGQETRDKIPELLAKGVLDADTRLVLTNAVYFKGRWATPFRAAATKDAPFHRADGSKTPAPLMNRFGEYRVVDDPNAAFQALELPYGRGDVAMVVLLPRAADGLPALEKQLTPEFYAATLGALRAEERVHVFLPKFRVEAESDLKQPLQKLGLVKAFREIEADFSAMTTAEKLFVSAVVHKAFVEVNEEGTEAAAATGAAFKATSAATAPDRPVVFRADRPFAFAIVHKPSRLPLFLGRYAGPA